MPTAARKSFAEKQALETIEGPERGAKHRSAEKVRLLSIRIVP